MPNALKSRSVRILAVVAVVFCLYAAAGFWVAPRLLRSALIDNIQKQLGVSPIVGDIRCNPLALQLELTDFSLPDAAGAKLVGFDRLFIDFSPSSLWRRALVFKAIEIDKPFVNAVVAVDGSLNLLKLEPKPAPTPEPNAGGKLPTVRVASFTVSRGWVSYEDLSRPSHFTTRLEPIDFDLRDFSTASEGQGAEQSGRFTFTGSSKLGERIEWHGRLGVQPVQSDGELRIDGLRVHTIWEYLADQLGFLVDSGTIDVAATYRFSLENAVDLKVNVSKLDLADVGIRARSEIARGTGAASGDASREAAADEWILVPTLSVTGASVDLASRVAHVDTVALGGVKLTTWLNPDQSFNLAQLAAAPVQGGPVPSGARSSGPAAPAVSSSGASAVSPATSAQPWRFDLREFRFQAASISAEDRSVIPAAKLMLAPLSLTLRGLSQDLTKPVGVGLDVSVNGSGRVHVNGEVSPQPLTANLALNLATLDLRALQPYIQRYTSMTLLGGRLSADAKVRYGAGKPAVLVNGNVHVEQLHTVDDALRDDFISWDRLDVLGIKYSHGPDRLDIDSVVARKPYARVIVEADESLNVKRVLTAAGSTAAPARSNPHSAAPAKAAPPMPMAIRSIVVHAGEANFSDLSVKPNFTAGIQALEGSVTGLSSKPNSRARIDLHGQVDAFAPVVISGEANVLSNMLYTDVAMSFKNMELTMFNPYSGKFAGYDITKGKLTTEFRYRVEGRKLDAQHHVIVDQLEFGEKTDSKDAVSLPVKLAVSLLKDRDGVIDLELPVTGSLDDPQFRLAPLIWKVLFSLLVKAVTAPFALLGSLFGGGPDMQFIDFGPGVSSLDPPAADRVKAVAKALIERPQLKIEVPIAVLPEVDRPALIEAKFNAELMDPALHARKGATEIESLTALYEKDFGRAPTFPTAALPAPPKDQLVESHVEFLKNALREHMVIAATDFRALAEQRATMVQQALLSDTQIDPARVFLVVNDKGKAMDGHARLELVLQ